MRLVPIIFFFLIPFLVKSQTVCTAESRERLDAFLGKISEMDLYQKSANELIIEMGKWFLNTPYVEKTLELPGEENLVINLTGLDCTTYLETVVTLTRLAKQGEYTFEDFERELGFLRYQDGERKGYPSRLHYFSDWIFQNEQKGILKDVTKEIGGKVYANNPTFMTSNPQYYAQLGNPENVNRLKVSEADISKRTYHYIPKEEVANHEQKIKPGDLIAITTSMQNLDIVHVGFAIEKNGRIHLLHAGTKNMKVEISEMPLHDYLKGNKSQSGIMVARLL
ncbi:N-acetylmuramoyl-L-alanine amidase-like domain-containing protein [Aquiflexum sp.]|uniref:N-acetylmuramoyl-L-alanine amidase-like domain-containing protein n=1 Tax=Aquiflexum sp. TaxID=1872584 RepID=UPI003593203E